MTPSAIIALIRDFAIVGALGFILWYVHRADQNDFKVQDLSADVQQLKTNAADAQRWQKEQTDATTQQASEMAKVSAAVNAQHAPILVCPHASSPGNVPGHTPSTPGATATSGRPDPGPGAVPQPTDIRGAIDAFELKYEGALASCRSVLAQWPH